MRGGGAEGCWRRCRREREFSVRDARSNALLARHADVAGNRSYSVLRGLKTEDPDHDPSRSPSLRYERCEEFEFGGRSRCCCDDKRHDHPQSHIGPLAHDDRQEGRHGGHRRGFCRLRDRPHARQSQNILWSERDQRLLAVLPGSGFSCAQLRTTTVACPDHSVRKCDSSRHCRDPTHSHEPGCAAHQIRRQARYRDDIRRTADALGRHAFACLHHFPPSALDRRRRRVRGGAVQASRRLPERGDGLLRLARRALLHRGDGRIMPAPQPRNLEFAANARLEHRPKHGCAQDSFACRSHPGVCWVHVGSGRGDGRLAALKEPKMLNAKIPSGPIEQQWDKCRFEMKLVSPANRRKHAIIVVGAGLAGAAAAATLGQQGYRVQCFSYHDTPRRAHSIAAQGGINAAKNYRNDGDSIFRLFKDTVKGGDFRAREANVYRLAQISLNIIDQCVAQGVPFAREYGGLLDNRSFGGVQVSRTFYARGQTGQQLLLGAYQALEEQVAAGTVTMHIRSELLDVVIVNGRARGIVTRDLVTGHIDCHAADVIVLATGGYSNVFYLSTNAKASNCTAIWRAHRRGALFGNPCFTQIHPTCIPLSSEHQSKLTLMSESLRNDGRVWVPKKQDDKRAPKDIPESEVDYYLVTTIPGLFAAGEANFSDHGANRLGASALMQGLADGYFVVPATVPDYIASTKLDPVDASHTAFRLGEAEVKDRINKLLASNGKRSPDSFHKELGKIVWDECGMARSDEGLRKALARIPELREEFWHNLRIVGNGEELNQTLDKANRVSDFMEIAELMCLDALDRNESCGGHFRVESQTTDGEAKRDDAAFSYTAAWEWTGAAEAPALHKEPLAFEYVPLSQRSYK